MSRADDYAILVGISDYPNIQVSPLLGPARDVEHFEKWLVDPKGGDVDPTHVFKLLSPKPRPDGVKPQQFPPTEEEFKETLRAIVLPEGQIERRPNGRIYLYFSGHGFSDFREKSLHAALYTANARKDESSNVCGTKFAEWCQRSAAFGEVILIMDCCRDVELSKEVLAATFNDKHDPKLAKKVRVLEIYAVPYGGKAQERVFLDEKGEQVHLGVLTCALVSALYGAPLEKVQALGKDQVRSGHALKEFIEGCWIAIAGENGPEPPEFVLPRTGDIAFSKEPPRSEKRGVRFAPPIAGLATLRVGNDEGQRVKVDLDAAAKTATIHTNGAGAPSVSAFDGTNVVLDLPPEIHELILEVLGAEPRIGMMPGVGDRNVTI